MVLHGGRTLADLSFSWKGCNSVNATRVREPSNSETNHGTVYGRHIPQLDGLRGIAILTVVWHNVSAGEYGDGGILGNMVNLIVNSGWAGVQLFFVLSGFLITGLLLDEKGQPHHLRNFFMRRVLRIFPLYYLVLGASLLAGFIFGWDQYWMGGYREYGIWYWAYLSNWVSVWGDITGFSHFWSLAVEEQYYLLWPACVLLLSMKSLLRLCLALVLSALAFRIAVCALYPDMAHDMAYQFTCARWDALAIGGICAVLIRHASLGDRVPRLSRVWVLAAITYALGYIAIYHNFAPTPPGVGALNQTLSAVGFGGWLLLSIGVPRTKLGHWNQRVLILPWLRLVGKYSYAIYIFHLPVKVISAPLWRHYEEQFGILGGAVNTTIYALLVFALSYIMALISWQLVEKPLLKWKRYFYARPEMSAG